MTSKYNLRSKNMTLEHWRLKEQPSNSCATFEVTMPTTKAKSGIPPRDSENHILELPREIRDETNKYLLTNPILGTCGSVNRVKEPGAKYATSPKYDLHPAVLRVCKLMYAEGRQMLYERNVFFMDCTNWMYRNELLRDRMPYAYTPMDEKDEFPITTALNVTPLTRYSEHHNVGPTDEDWVWLGSQCFSEQPTLSRLVGPQANYARKWKVIVNGDTGTCSRKFDRPALAQFCHAVHQRSELSLSFLIFVDTTPEMLRQDLGLFDRRLTFDKIFSSPKVLRKVNKVEFREAHCSSGARGQQEDDAKELLGYINKKFPCRVVDVSATTITTQKLEKEYSSLMKGSSQLIDPIHLMCDAFVEYAQTFERILHIRQNMDISTDTHKLLFPENTSNLFKRPRHTIENLLRDARAAALFDKMNKFKAIRKQVLKEFEKQYKKINQSSAKLYNLIKKDRIFRGILLMGGNFDNGIYTCQGRTLNLNKNTPVKLNWQRKLTQGLLLLEDYLASFLRDMTNLPLKLRIEYRLHEGTYSYPVLPREQLMRQIRNAYVAWDYNSFLQYFKEAVDDMDSQWREIREAKKNVFRWDSGRTLRGFDVEDVEAIVWDEIEPVQRTVLDFDYNCKQTLATSMR
ncbi:hypothetical protein EYC80_002372 [Monilinia laxa]|uniref:Uncharacterized protein n=1 Tax=Monilinia laxa TaxID=61186 RepID=A0A5N6K3P1_MONLA|nr:hypothetical protein EYC80_002372 [Monilinia laxa]